MTDHYENFIKAIEKMDIKRLRNEFICSIENLIKFRKGEKTLISEIEKRLEELMRWGDD